jgi:hypothetical protein
LILSITAGVSGEGGKGAGAITVVFFLVGRKQKDRYPYNSAANNSYWAAARMCEIHLIVN